MSERARLGRDWYWPHLAPSSSWSLTQSLVLAPMVTVTGLALASCVLTSWGLARASLCVGAGGCDRLDTDNTSGGDNSGATSDNLFLIIIPGPGLSSGVEVRENAPES